MPGHHAIRIMYIQGPSKAVENPFGDKGLLSSHRSHGAATSPNLRALRSGKGADGPSGLGRQAARKGAVQPNAED